MVIETLSLPKNEILIEDFETKTKSFLCELEFDIGTTQKYAIFGILLFYVSFCRESFLAHIITKHKLVIGDVELISDLTSYVAYWRKRFLEKKSDLTQFCAVIKTNSNKNDLVIFFLNNIRYYQNALFIFYL